MMFSLGEKRHFFFFPVQSDCSVLLYFILLCPIPLQRKRFLHCDALYWKWQPSEQSGSRKGCRLISSKLPVAVQQGIGSQLSMFVVWQIFHTRQSLIRLCSFHLSSQNISSTLFESGLCFQTSHPCLQIKLRLTGPHKYCSKTLAISPSHSVQKAQSII